MNDATQTPQLRSSSDAGHPDLLPVPPVEVSSLPTAQPEVSGLKLQQVFRLLLVSLPLLVLVGLLAGVGAARYVNAQPDMYVSEARFLVGPLQAPYDAIGASASVAATYADDLSSDDSMQGLIDNANLQDVEASDVHDYVRVTANKRSRIVSVQTTWDEPQRAQLMAQILVERAMDIEESAYSYALPADISADEEAAQLLRNSIPKIKVIQEPRVSDEAEAKPTAAVAAVASIVAVLLTLILLLWWADTQRGRGGQRLRQFRSQETLAVIDELRRDELTSGRILAGKDTAGAKVLRRLLVRLPQRSPRSVAFVDVAKGQYSRSLTERLAQNAVSQGIDVILVDLSHGQKPFSARAKASDARLPRLGRLIVASAEYDEIQLALSCHPRALILIDAGSLAGSIVDTRLRHLAGEAVVAIEASDEGGLVLAQDAKRTLGGQGIATVGIVVTRERSVASRTSELLLGPTAG